MVATQKRRLLSPPPPRASVVLLLVGGFVVFFFLRQGDILYQCFGVCGIPGWTITPILAGISHAVALLVFVMCKERRNSIERIILIIAMIFWLSISFDVLAFNRRGEARTNTCMTNQRQIALGIQMYTQDNDGCMPTDLHDTEIYIGNFPRADDPRNDLYYCPSSIRLLQRPGGYGFNANLIGVQSCIIKKSDEVLLTADSVTPFMALKSQRDIAVRHTKGYVASFADGHIEQVTATSKHVRLK